MPRVRTYFLVDKPYGVLSQFTREADHHRVLGDLYDFPPDVYPVGRLDRDSEGILILTNDKRLNEALLHPRHGHQRTYWVQVEGLPDVAAIDRLNRGVTIKAKGKTHRCAPVPATPLPASATTTLPERDPPVRFRKQQPTSWWAVTLTEGKNRQVRRMWAAVGYPVLRLIRHSIEGANRTQLEGQTVVRIREDRLIPLLGLRL